MERATCLVLWGCERDLTLPSVLPRRALYTRGHMGRIIVLTPDAGNCLFCLGDSVHSHPTPQAVDAGVMTELRPRTPPKRKCIVSISLPNCTCLGDCAQQEISKMLQLSPLSVRSMVPVMMLHSPWPPPQEMCSSQPTEMHHHRSDWSKTAKP